MPLFSDLLYDKARKMLHKRTKTLQDLKNIRNSDWVRSQNIENFSLKDLKSLQSEDLQYLYKKKIDELSEVFLKTRENISNEKFCRYEQSEVKKFIAALRKFHKQCKVLGLSTEELEDESIEFITDESKRFFFKSKWANRFYKINNSIVGSGLSYWSYHSVTKLGTVNSKLLRRTLLESALPIAWTTGLAFKFWSYIIEPISPSTSNFLGGVSKIALSPIWAIEYGFNFVTGNIFKVKVPLNVVGEVSAGSGLSWDQLKHTSKFVRDMKKSLDQMKGYS